LSRRRTVTAIFVTALLVFFGALFSHNLQVGGFPAKQAAIEAGSDASSAKIAVKEWDVPTPNSHPYDPALAPNGAHWYTGQESNTLGSRTL
jgi:streptogramin lyase